MWTELNDLNGGEIKTIRKISILKILNFPQRLRWPTFSQLYPLVQNIFCWALYWITRHLQMHTKMADGPEMISILLPSLVLSFPTMIFMFVLSVRRVFCFWMCLPIAVAPCSLRVLFAAPFKERSKAHLSARHCNRTQTPQSLLHP